MFVKRNFFADLYDPPNLFDMALTESNMLSLGTQAPDFNLPDTVSGKQVSLDDIRSEVATVVMFLCNHCPYVIHVNKGIVS